MKVVFTLSPRDYDAVLFDLDGVLTKTARVHASAWKKLFDSFLEQRAIQTGEPIIPFAIDTDYPRYVDGKPRYDGVADFLESRGIELPLGESEDGPDVQSVRALGNLKDRYFLEHLEQDGVETYEAAIALVRELRAQELKTAVVSSSNNCAAVLEKAGIAQLFEVRTVKLLSYHQELDLRHGMLLRSISFEDDQGRHSTLKERRLVSMDDMHLGTLELTLTADNWSAGVTVRSAIDGRIVNAEAKLYRKFNNMHLEPLSGKVHGEDAVYLAVRTCQSNIHVAQVARTRVFIDGELLEVRRLVIEEPGYIGQELTVEVKQGETLVLEKMVSLYTGRDRAISECGLEAQKLIAHTGRFDAVLANHILAWKHLWRRFDVHIRPADPGFKVNIPMLIRFNMFHLLQAVSPNSIGLDTGVSARGWTGEAYQGHVFWDELFIFPIFNYRMPEITRSLLMYRYWRLGEARAAAAVAGYKGAMFPWQSGSDGQEETQVRNLNPRSQRWVPETATCSDT